MKKRIVSILMTLTLVMCAGGLTACDVETDSPGKDKETQSEESQNSEESESSEIPEVVPEKIVVSVPEGFEKSEENGTITYAKEDTGSNIILNQTPNDGSLATTTGKMLVEILEPQLEETYETELTVTLVKDEKIEVDGHKGLFYSFSYEYLGFEIIQTQYILENGDVYEFVTYTDMTFEGFTEAFNTSQASIAFEEVGK